MKLPEDLKFLEKPLSWLSINVTPFALIRIALWTITFLILAHIITPRVAVNLPYQNEMAEQGIIPLTSATSDARWIRNDLKTLPDNSLVWIGGSSIAIKNNDESYSFLPGEVKTNHQHYVGVKMARRLLDTYTMTLDAIARKPSAMVIALNPFWELNDKSLFFKTNVMNEGASLWANSNDWAMVLLMTSPDNMLWSTVGKHHYVVGNGYDILKSLQPPKKPKSKAHKAKKKKKGVNYNQSTTFWLAHQENAITDIENIGASEWQERIIEFTDLDNNNFAEKLIHQLFQSVSKSNIPTFIYLPPLSPEFRNNPAYQEIVQEFDRIAAKYPNVNYTGTFPNRALRGMQFIDHLHLTDTGAFPRYLSQEISDMIAQETKE